MGLSVGHRVADAPPESYRPTVQRREERRYTDRTSLISSEAETLHLTQYQMVGAVGLEPTIQKAGDFKSPAYASSATPPYSYYAHTSFLLPFNYSTRSTVST